MCTHKPQHTAAVLFGGYQACSCLCRVSTHYSVRWQAEADMFRAVSLWFLFIHKQRPTVITTSFKYQRAPLKSSRSQRWPPVRPHDFSRETHVPEEGTFYWMQAKRFFVHNNKLHPNVLDGNGRNLSILLLHSPWERFWNMPSEGHCPLSPHVLWH